jgi:low affinity Fe/Cu permease
MKLKFFSRIAKWLSGKAAQPVACFLAFFAVLIWGVLGFFLHFSVLWHLIISTVASVVSILMLFIIQNSVNRDTIAIQLKLDELIRATQGAHNTMMDIQKLTDEDLAKIQKRYGLLAQQSKEDLKKGKKDTHTPEIGA